MIPAFHRMLVEEMLRPLRNTRVGFVPNTGNAGDALITIGALHCFRRLGIRYEIVNSGSNVADMTIILGGGGNLIPDYNTIRNALRKFKDVAKRVILLPQTIRGNEDLLSELPPSVTLFCRDIESYNHVSSIADKATVILTHDMAFHIDVDDILFRKSAMDEYQSAFMENLEKKSIDLNTLLKKPAVYYTRSDRESAGRMKKRDLDLSAIFALGTSPGTAEKSSWCFLEMIRISPKIITDRLHVGIGAALVGKECELHDNAYGKNREVYRHSMKYHFPHISFIEE